MKSTLATNGTPFECRASTLLSFIHNSQTMRQFTLQSEYHGYPQGQVFQGPYNAKSQSNRIYCPINALPGPEGTDVGLFESFITKSSLFKEVTNE
jgi:hypothetical protein